MPHQPRSRNRQIGSGRSNRQRVRATLDQIAASGDPDFASFATWSRDTLPSTTLLAEMIKRLE